MSLSVNDTKFIGASVAVGAFVAGAMWWLFNGSKKSKFTPTLVDKKEKYTLKLIKRTEISPDTRIFRFELPSDQHVLGLPTGKHVNLSARIDGKLCIRAYTPVSSDATDQGYVDFIIKVYFPNVHPKFPEGGKMTMHLEKMKIGDTIDIRGPNGLLEYKTGRKVFIAPKAGAEPELRFVRQLGLIAGGSGITPMLQIMRHVIREKDDVELFLLYANQTEADILCREELDEMAKNSNGRVHVHYTLDRPPTDWKYSSGFIDEEMLIKSMPKRQMAEDTTILICGPPPMVKFACLPNLKKMAFQEDEHIFVY